MATCQPILGLHTLIRDRAPIWLETVSPSALQAWIILIGVNEGYVAVGAGKGPCRILAAPVKEITNVGMPHEVGTRRPPGPMKIVARVRNRRSSSDNHVCVRGPNGVVS